jgi:hypothetical protein
MRFPVYQRLSGAGEAASPSPGRSRRAGLVGLVLGLGLWFAPAAQAHDQLEITGTIYLRTNHLELFVEMEGRPARLLAKAPEASGAEEVLARLEARASSLFRIGSGETTLVPTSVAVLPGQEDHLRLRLLFPVPDRGPLKVEAPLLTELAAAGGYGVSLTVLDMVNQRVVGQSVLFADQAAVTFDSGGAAVATGEVRRAGTNSSAAVAVKPAPVAANPDSAPNKHAGGSRRPAAGWLGLALAGIGLAWWWQTRRA